MNKTFVVPGSIDAAEKGANVTAGNFAALDKITREKFAETFAPKNVALLASLKHLDPARYQTLREKWRSEKFPAQSDLTKMVDKALSEAKQRGKQNKAEQETAARDTEIQQQGLTKIDPDDVRGAAREFMGDVRRNLIYTNGSWLDFRHNCYVELEDDHVRSDMWDFLEDTFNVKTRKPLQPTTAMVTSVLDALKGMCFRERHAYTPPVWFRPQPHDLSPGEIVACHNGLLHIPTQRLMPLTPRFFTYNGLPFDYSPVEKCGPPVEWLRFLNDIWSDSPESISALQEIFGYLLTNDTSQQKIFLIVGPPRSGKGTIGRVLTSLLGKDNCSSPSLKALGKDFGMETLIGKQLMLVSDMRVSRSSDTGEITGNILRISGEDDINVARKFKGDWVGKLSARLMLLSNVPLMMPDMSGALINRIVPLVLKRSYLGQEDTKLTDRLLKELPAILNWAIEGWGRLNERGHFLLTPDGIEMNRHASSHAAPVHAFLDECCEIAPMTMTDKDTLFRAFEHWVNDAGVTRLFDPGMFGKELLVASGYRVSTTRPRDDKGKQVPHYAGVRLKPEWEARAKEELPVW